MSEFIFQLTSVFQEHFPQAGLWPGLVLGRSWCPHAASIAFETRFHLALEPGSRRWGGRWERHRNAAFRAARGAGIALSLSVNLLIWELLGFVAALCSVLHDF